MAAPFTISKINHPEFLSNSVDWLKWRRTAKGGRQFIDAYLKQFTSREDATDFALRKCVSYCPGFAKAAVQDIENAVFSRMADISRVGGSPTYQKSMRGLTGGVDNKGNSMNSFIGANILPELLTMRKVGIYVDMPSMNPNPSLYDAQNKRPYLYFYPAESICNWLEEEDCDEGSYTAVLLQDTVFEMDEKTGFPIGYTTRYRRLWMDDENGRPVVRVAIYDDGNLSPDNPSESYTLNLPRLPFISIEIPCSAYEDIADYQIALLNLESSDIAYTLKSNFPFYTEQFDPKSMGSPYLNSGDSIGFDSDGNPLPGGTASDSATASDREIKIGVSAGRAYPVGTDRPEFINPSAEPLKISMEKQSQIKKDIRLLLHLTITNLATQGRASADAKMVDERSLENGLAAIGLTLEKAEREIARVWAAYEGSNSDVATVNYPQDYSLKSDSERRAEADELNKLLTAIPSRTYQQELSKRVAQILLSTHANQDTMETIYTEIDDAVNMVADPEIIAKDVENGLVSPETASLLRGYPKGEAEKAANAHAKRAAAIADAQATASLNNGAARGVPDASVNPAADGKTEKKNSRNTTLDPSVKSKVRGQGK